MTSENAPSAGAPPSRLLVVSCSLSPVSRSAGLAERLAEVWRAEGDEAELVDLRELALPLCDGGEAFGDANVLALAAKVRAADAVALALPVYNYDVGGAARNLVALLGRAWSDKVVGLLGAAGGHRSYMALTSVACSLMLDFRCVIVPRFVYASAQPSPNPDRDAPELERRIARLARDLRRFAAALNEDGRRAAAG